MHMKAVSRARLKRVCLVWGQARDMLSGCITTGESEAEPSLTPLSGQYLWRSFPENFHGSNLGYILLAVLGEFHCQISRFRNYIVSLVLPSLAGCGSVLNTQPQLWNTWTQNPTTPPPPTWNEMFPSSGITYSEVSQCVLVDLCGMFGQSHLVWKLIGVLLIWKGLFICYTERERVSERERERAVLVGSG